MFNNIGKIILLLYFVASVLACELLPSVLDKARYALNSVESNNIKSVIIAVGEVQSQESGCTTITHTAIAVSKLKQYLNATREFSIDTVLYITYTNSSASFGAYNTIPYSTDALNIYKKDSPVNIALVAYDNFLEVYSAYSKQNKTAIVTVEEGNRVYLDISYYILHTS
ncbi:hypothetical protein BDF19DRAFT_493297 [Syncephalis fuscata]|nr:hypothetical protein BDF19DRAFT_493297 [Syncephalis fuscata]